MAYYISIIIIIITDLYSAFRSEDTEARSENTDGQRDRVKPPLSCGGNKSETVLGSFRYILMHIRLKSKSLGHE